MEELLPYDKHLKDPQTTVCTVILISATQGQHLIKRANRNLPLTQFGLAHIKRIRKHPCGSSLELVVAPETCPCPEFLEEATECPTCARSVFSVYIPALAPYTPEQARLWSVTWPVQFKPQHTQPLEHSAVENRAVKFICSEALAPLKAVLYEPASEGVHVGQLGQGPLDHPVMVALAQFRPEGNQYYCTGMWAFTYEEPCPMCAMALVHSRLQRVYFYKKDRDNGAFTVHKLHLQPLNHMYRVFKLSRSEFS